MLTDLIFSDENFITLILFVLLHISYINDSRRSSNFRNIILRPSKNIRFAPLRQAYYIRKAITVFI